MNETTIRTEDEIFFQLDSRLSELAFEGGCDWGSISCNGVEFGRKLHSTKKAPFNLDGQVNNCFYSLTKIVLPDGSGGVHIRGYFGSYTKGGNKSYFDSEREMDRLESDGGFRHRKEMEKAATFSLSAEEVQARQEESKRKRDTAFMELVSIYAEAEGNPNEHPYAVRKGLLNLELSKVKRSIVWKQDALIFPVVSLKGLANGERTIQAFQIIFSNGDKRTIGSQSGGVIIVGDWKQTDGRIVAEGFATSYSAMYNEELNPKKFGAVSCMDAGNLAIVVGVYTGIGGETIIAADNDVRPAGKEYIGNTGIEKALSAAFRHGVKQIYVPYNEEGTKTDFADVTTFKVMDVPKKFMDLLLFLRDNNLSSNSNRISNDIIYSIVREIPHKLTVNKAIEKLLQVMPDRTPTTLKEEINKLLDSAKNKIEKNLLKKERLAEVNRDWEAEKGYIIIDTNRTGSGKTEAMVKWSQELDKGIKQIIVTPRVTLVDDVAPKFGAAHYKIAEDSDMVIATTMNSLVKFNNLDGCALFVDEFNLGKEHIAIGTVSPRKPCYDKFCETFRNAGVVFIADAFFNEASYQWVNEHSNGKKIVFVEHTEGAYAQSDITMWVDTQGYESLADRLMEDLKKGLNIAMACDNKGIVCALVQRAVKEGIIAEEEGLAYTSLTNGEARQVQWVRDANKCSENLRLLAYSPSISSGVSIKTDHFDKTYLFYDGTVCYDTFLQMARRIRNVTVWCAAFKNINHERMMTNKEMLMQGENDKNKDMFIYYGDDAALNELGKLRIDVMTNTAEKKQNAAQGFCLAAEMFENVTIEHFEEHGDGGGSGLLKEFVGIHKKEVREKIEVANNISSNRYEELNNKVVNTMEENFEKEKHNVQAMSGKQEVDETDIKRYQQKGMQVIQRFEMLHKDKLEVVAQSGDNLRSQDKMACDAFLYQVVYEMLNIISQASNRLIPLAIFQLMEVLVRNRKGLSSCGFMDYGTVGGARQAATIQNFLNKFGIKLTKIGRLGSQGYGGCIYQAEEIEWVKQYSMNRGKVSLTGVLI